MVRDTMNTKKTALRDGFKPGEYIVYPAHGVGQVTAVEEQEIAGFKLELFVVSFAKEKMTLRVPVAKVASVGMRKLSDADGISKALDILTGRARVKRTVVEGVHRFVALVNPANDPPADDPSPEVMDVGAV